MREKETKSQDYVPDIINERLQTLEEKFLYQELTIDTLNDVIIEQQSQLNALEDRLQRLQSLLTSLHDSPDDGEEPPPPHY